MKYGLGDRGHGDRGQGDLQKLRRRWRKHEGRQREGRKGGGCGNECNNLRIDNIMVTVYVSFVYHSYLSLYLSIL